MKFSSQKSNPVSYSQELAPSPQTFFLTGDARRWCDSPPPMLKARVNIATKSKPIRVVLSSAAATCVIFVKPGLRYLSDFSSNKLFSFKHTPLLFVLYHQNVKCLSDNAELCYLSHITTCQMFPDRSYLKKKKTESLVLKLWITQFQNEEVFNWLCWTWRYWSTFFCDVCDGPLIAPLPKSYQ